VQLVNRRAFVAGVRVVVTIALLCALLARVDTERLAQVLANVSPVPFVFALAALALAITLNAVRWHFVLGAVNASPGTSRLIRITFVGQFFNQVLPTGIGGDVVRAWRCYSLGIRLGTAIRSLLLDRASGYAIIVLLYAAGLPMLFHTVADDLQRQVFIAVFILSVAGLAALFFVDYLPVSFRRLKLLASFAIISGEARSLVANWWRITMILGLSLLGAGLNILTYERIGSSIGAHISLVEWLLIVPPVTLVQLIPLSIAGWGIREVALVAVMTAFGASSEVALATSLLFGAVQILVGLPGGLIWLTRQDVPRDVSVAKYPPVWPSMPALRDETVVTPQA
jgi:uncharacterized protein (TIRG00374 family)